MITQQKKRKMNPMLMNVILISAAAHVILGFVLGGITIVKYIIPDEAKFEEPPEIVEEEPPPEVKVEIKQQAKPDNQPLNQLRMQPVANIAVPNVAVDLPNMSESFTVSAGIGGLGGGNLMGGARGSLGLGMSDVSVFGLKTRAERILFVIDTNRHMVTDKKGGLNSYGVIKKEITDMVGNLSAGTLFNVMLQDRKRTMLFKPQIVPAGKQVHQELVDWIAPINNDAQNPGLEALRNKAPVRKLATFPDELVHKSISRYGFASNESAYITQLCLEQSIDAIFLITGYHRGFEVIRRGMTEKEQADWEKKISDKKYIEQMAEHQAEKPEMQKRINAELAQINKERAAKGQPGRVLNQRNGIYSNASELNLKWKTPHPGSEPRPVIDPRETGKYFKNLVETLYTDQDSPIPSVNVVLFLAGDENYKPEWEKSLKSYVRFFKGKSRIIRGENEIKSARSANQTTNN